MGATLHTMEDERREEQQEMVDYREENKEIARYVYSI